MTNIAECLAQTLKECRRDRGWSLDKVAEKAGLTKSYIWEIEKGRTKNPTVETVEKIARVFALDPAALCGWHDHQSIFTPQELETIVLLREIEKRYAHKTTKKQ